MNGGVPVWLWPVTHLATAVVFLLLGWRFGRESRGKPAFDFPVLPSSGAQPLEEADPWTVAAWGEAELTPELDKIETVRSSRL